MWSDWLVFCYCGFHSVSLMMKKDKRLMEASWWERLTEGKLGLVLIGRALLSKSLIPFSVDGWGCVLSLLFDLRPKMVAVMKIMVTYFKGPMQALLHSVLQTLQQTTTNPCVCQRLLDTHGQFWFSLLWGHCSFLLGPGAQKVLFVPSKSLSPSPV